MPSAGSCRGYGGAASPELFPQGMQEGYQLTGRLPESEKMPGVRLRQVRLKDGCVFTLRPSFVMSYMTGTVEELEHPLLLLSLGVPCWAVTKIFERNDMYWHRLLERLGRNSLVGTTVRDPARLPEHLADDEHHTDWCGEKGYVAFTDTSVRASDVCEAGLSCRTFAHSRPVAASPVNTSAPPTDSTKANTTPIGYTTFRSARHWRAPGRLHRKR